MNSLKGLGVAMITPFTTEKKVNFQQLKQHTEFLIKGNTNYLVALGTTAETATLSKQEKKEVLQTIILQNQGRIPLVVGLGGNNTQQVLADIHEQDFEGIDAILTASPYYNKPSQEGLIQHFTAIAEASPRPVVLYNIPGRTGVNMSISTITQLAQHPNIIAIKEAAGSIEQMGAIIQSTPDDFLVISGDDGLTLPMIALGGSGVISVLGNARPQAWSKMVDLCLQGNFAEARKIHYHYLELIELLFVDGNPAGIKALLQLQGQVEGELRLPLVSAPLSTQEKMKAWLN